MSGIQQMLLGAVPAGPAILEILIVAGGGGAKNDDAGGAGAGGVVYSSSFTATAGTCASPSAGRTCSSKALFSFAVFSRSICKYLFIRSCLYTSNSLKVSGTTSSNC